jgi:hypothetical protein
MNSFPVVRETVPFVKGNFGPDWISHNTGKCFPVLRTMFIIKSLSRPVKQTSKVNDQFQTENVSWLFTSFHGFSLQGSSGGKSVNSFIPHERLFFCIFGLLLLTFLGQCVRSRYSIGVKRIQLCYLSNALLTI